jgi:hypothetical protein
MTPIETNTKDFLRLGVPLGQATRRATDYISEFIPGGGDKPLSRAIGVVRLPTGLVRLVCRV